MNWHCPDQTLSEGGQLLPQGLDTGEAGNTHLKAIRDFYPSQSARYSFSWFDWFCLWYPPGWLILFNRHWQHYHADPEGWNWLEYLLFLIPGGFYLALLLRWIRLGFRSPRSEQVEMNSAYQAAFRQEILTPILKYHFRAELHQLENLPQTGNLIVTINHAGMCFPWDIIGLGVMLSQVRDWTTRPVAHEIFFDHSWLRWWLPAGWSKVLGGVRAEASCVEAAIQQQAAGEASTLLYAPEGWRGLVKGWRYRYQLQTFDPSFIRLSDRYRIPILPVVCIGNEYLHPWTVNLKRMARWLGMPIFPLSPLLLVFVLFPSMGVWANRTRLRYYIQPLQQIWETQSTKENQSRTTAYQTAQRLRSNLQGAIDRLRRANKIT